MSERLNIDMTLKADFFARFQDAFGCGSLIKHIENTWVNHFLFANVLMVHAGVNPVDIGHSLSLGHRQHESDRPWHWAWVRDPFLSWTKPFTVGERPAESLLVLHGHTVAEEARRVPENTEDMVQIMRHHGRVNLDMGAAKGVAIGSAILCQDRLRLLRTACR